MYLQILKKIELDRRLKRDLLAFMHMTF